MLMSESGIIHVKLIEKIFGNPDRQTGMASDPEQAYIYTYIYPLWAMKFIIKVLKWKKEILK